MGFHFLARKPETFAMGCEAVKFIPFDIVQETSFPNNDDSKKIKVSDFSKNFFMSIDCKINFGTFNCLVRLYPQFIIYGGYICCNEIFFVINWHDYSNTKQIPNDYEYFF